MRVYLDVCCLHRPLDDQTQPRVRLETEAVLLILEMCAGGTHQWITSEAVEWEAARNPDDEKRHIVEELLRFADERLIVGESAMNRARTFVGLGISAFDALHLAVAESGKCDVLLTTDARFVSRSRSAKIQPLDVRVINPAEWVLEVQP